MNIDTIITALKARCPSFGSGELCRISGAAEYAQIDESVKMSVPAAYVVPMDDEVDNQESTNGYRQVVRDVFAVIVVLSNTTNERGQTSIVAVEDIRTELFAALLGWRPDASHDRIEYEGGQLMGIDRARLFYQFEFAADMELREEDTYQHVFNNALPLLKQVGIELDAIDPFDPNLVTIGPDGRIEVSADITALDQ